MPSRSDIRSDRLYHLGTSAFFQAFKFLQSVYVNVIECHLLPHLLVPTLLSVLAAAAPTSVLEARTGRVRFGYTDACGDPYNTYETSGELCVKVAYAARGVVVYNNDGCEVRTFSGIDCRGSSKVIDVLNQCVNVPFGSIRARCG
ncbi:hypothetical protein BJX64DRAFT_295320 [Aspergillus heterothallicus]